MTEVQALNVRSIQSPTAQEFYLTATPSAGDTAEQAAEIYGQVAEHLRSTGARITAERLFAAPGAIQSALAARSRALADLDDGLCPTLLRTPERAGILGLQLHAITGIDAPTLLPAARRYQHAGIHYLEGSGLLADPLTSDSAQARQCFATMGDLLGRCGASLFDVARTWIFMDDILAWYPELNRVRNAYFTESGLFTRPGCLPASTGIGVSPARGRIALDFLAAWGKPDVIERFHAIGNQRSAYEYGSAFARASQVQTPAGTTVFCSGTAAIDSAGKTCHLDDIRGQVAMTIENVYAVLRDMNCRGSDVVQAMAYCANPAVAEHFAAAHAEHEQWPILTMIADVCRADLLFEIEVTACPGAAEAVK